MFVPSLYRQCSAPHRDLGDMLVVFAPRERRVLRLPPTARLVWLELERPHSVDSLVTVLGGPYPDIDRATIELTVSSLIESLLAAGLVSST